MLNLGKLLNFSKPFPQKTSHPPKKNKNKISILDFLLKIMRKYLQSNMADGEWPANALPIPSSYSEKNTSIKTAVSTCSVINRTEKMDAMIFPRNGDCFIPQWFMQSFKYRPT